MPRNLIFFLQPQYMCDEKERYIAQLPLPLCRKNDGVWRLSGFYSSKREDNLGLQGLFLPTKLSSHPQRTHRVKKQEMFSAERESDQLHGHYKNLKISQKDERHVLYSNTVEFKVVTSYGHYLEILLYSTTPLIGTINSHGSIFIC